MLFSKIKQLHKSQGFGARTMMVAAFFAAWTAGSTFLASESKATDLDFSRLDGEQTDDGHFLRIGLLKSAVIKLPAAVKDVIVGDPSVVDVVIRNKNTAYLFGRSPAQTNIFFFDANGQQILQLDIDVTMDTKALQKLIERNVIEIAPLAYMRGRTLNDAFVILDEAQNTTIEQMKMFLTRIGFGSTAVITGDLTQVDLPRGQKSGLRDAIEVLKGVDGLSFTLFTAQDVVRHPLVARIVRAYEARDGDG